jgi:hypothetical protein
VVVQDPGYLGIQVNLAGHGATVRPVPVDDAGLHRWTKSLGTTKHAHISADLHQQHGSTHQVYASVPFVSLIHHCQTVAKLPVRKRVGANFGVAGGG